jgi:enoyl-CoA hydratase
VLNTDQRSGVLVIQLEHGKVNALDLELLRALIGAFRDAGPQQPIVLTGAGRAFSAGVDLLRISEGGARYVREFLGALSDCFLAVFDHPGPVVAAINGAAIAGGCVIAAACDRRLLAPEQAQAVGLVDEVLPAGELLPRALAEARRLAALPPGVFAFTKRQLHGPARERIAARGEDDRTMRDLWASDAVHEAISRYMAGLRTSGRPDNGGSPRG